MTSFITAGIDVGTTSTHLTISRLELANSSRINQAPRLSISGREIVFQSDIHLTPLTSDGIIDADLVFELIAADYRSAAIDPRDVRVGAAIITGETAKKRNAEKVIHALSEFAGELVGASAGAHLEGMMAARGSGAAGYSRRTGKTVLNMDIGGGTTNFSVLKKGELIDSACITLGGRFVTFDRVREKGLEIRSFTESGLRYANESGCKVTCGDFISRRTLEDLSLNLAQDLIAFSVRHQKPPDPPQKSKPISVYFLHERKGEKLAAVDMCRFLSTDDLRFDYQIDEIWLSGGVAEFIRNERIEPDQFGDAGGFLGAALKFAFDRSGVEYKVPPNPIRATVMGAGMFTMQVTGSTISIDESSLPLRNVRIVRPFVVDGPLIDDDKFLEQLNRTFSMNEVDWSRSPLAIEVPQMKKLDFKSLKALANKLSSAYKAFSGSSPFILVCEQDCAMAMGLLLKDKLRDGRLIVIDGISTEEGDFIDIGQPLSGDDHGATNTLPVVVKTLLF